MPPIGPERSRLCAHLTAGWRSEADVRITRTTAGFFPQSNAHALLGSPLTDRPPNYSPTRAFQKWGVALGSPRHKHLSARVTPIQARCGGLARSTHSSPDRSIFGFLLMSVM